MLIAFSGLPGTGKTTLARAIAHQRQAVYLRIDTIEHALRNAAVLARDVGPAGYEIAYALARENLRLGQSVIADSVNPLRITRDAWRDVAADASVPLVEIEVICSDSAVHRRRVERRLAENSAAAHPSWESVERREYAHWDRPPIVLDSAMRSPAELLSDLSSVLANSSDQ